MVTKKDFFAAKKIVIAYWQQLIKERGISVKMLETELYVDIVIKKTGKPPTYRDVVEKFNLKSSSAAYARLRRYRYKMSPIAIK